MEIGKIIKENRTAKNMTQEDLANEFFVSRPLISKWENGRSYPDLEQLLKLSDFFDLTLDELMRGDKKMTKKLNMTIKRKPIFIGVIIILIIAITLIGYKVWTEQNIQLKPSDIEITSVKTEKNPSIKQVNIDTKETITLPEDVSYTIKYKVKKPFTAIRSGYYIGQNKEDLFVDMRGKNTLFPSDKEQIFVILSDSKNYGDNENIDIDENFSPSVIKDKDVKILEISGWDGEFSDTKTNSWVLLNKSDLKK